MKKKRQKSFSAVLSNGKHRFCFVKMNSSDFPIIFAKCWQIGKQIVTKQEEKMIKFLTILRFPIAFLINCDIITKRKYNAKNVIT